MYKKQLFRIVCLSVVCEYTYVHMYGNKALCLSLTHSPHFFFEI